MSEYLTQGITSQDELLIKGPVWHYTDSKKHKNYLLVSTGSWLSPNVGLFQHLVYESWDYDQIINLFGEKTHDDIVPEIIDIFNNWWEKVKTITHLSRQSKPFPPVKGGEGGLSYSPWRIQSSISSAIEKLGTNTSCFLCGKPEMVDEVRSILEELGVASEDITFEKY